jgi:hypothetical protein
VVDEIVAAGKDYNYGLEAGSKPELMIALAMHEGAQRLIICNGYKDTTTSAWPCSAASWARRSSSWSSSSPSSTTSSASPRRPA